MSAENLAMVVAALNALGKLLKNNPHVPDAWIPTVLAVVGCIVSMCLAGWTVPVGIEGLIAGTAAVGVHQVYTQLKNGKNDEKTTVSTPAGGPPAGTATAG